MTVTANRTVVVNLTGDVELSDNFDAAENLASPGAVELLNLSSGFNTITVRPTATAVTIIPPALNTTSITLKGVTGDTGIRIHNTDPTTIALHSTVTTIGLTAGAAITGVRFLWT